MKMMTALKDLGKDDRTVDLLGEESTPESTTVLSICSPSKLGGHHTYLIHPIFNTIEAVFQRI